jgi:hypothetical protein
MLFGFCDAGGVVLPLYWARECRATIDAREGGPTLAVVTIQLWFLHDVRTCCMKRNLNIGLQLSQA